LQDLANANLGLLQKRIHRVTNSLASQAGEVAQDLGWKMLIGKIVIEDAHLEKGR
jgi:hypothetical protein